MWSVAPRRSQGLPLPFVFPRNFLLERPKHIQSRPQTLENMNRVLIPSYMNPVSNAGPRTFILTGLGGIGKTETARDFAIQNGANFDAVFFVVADQREKLNQQYADIATQLGLVDPRSTSGPETDREKLKLWLANTVKGFNDSIESSMRATDSSEDKIRWLLILDNVENVNLLQDFWPCSGSGSIILTGRDPFMQCRTTATRQQLECLSTEDSVNLLKKIARCETDTEDNNRAAKAIAGRLGGLPLAIDQVGSIIWRRSLSLTGCARDFSQSPDFHQLYDEYVDITSYEHNLGSVWAFDSLEAEDKTAFSLLGVLSVLDPTCIQEELILQSLLVATIENYPRSKVEYHNALDRLMERSLVQKDSDTASLSLHRLVQDATRTRILNRNQFAITFDIAMKSVTNYFPFRDEKMNTAGSVHRWKRCGAAYAHVSKLSDVSKEMMATSHLVVSPIEFMELLYEAAWYDNPILMPDVFLFQPVSQFSLSNRI